MRRGINGLNDLWKERIKLQKSHWEWNRKNCYSNFMVSFLVKKRLFLYIYILFSVKNKNNQTKTQIRLSFILMIKTRRNDFITHFDNYITIFVMNNTILHTRITTTLLPFSTNTLFLRKKTSTYFSYQNPSIGDLCPVARKGLAIDINSC